MKTQSRAREGALRTHEKEQCPHRLIRFLLVEGLAGAKRN
jgi:hypothetical protein